MNINDIKTKILEKLDKEISWIDKGTTADVDQKLSITIKNLSETYKNLCDIKEVNNEKDANK